MVRVNVILRFVSFLDRIGAPSEKYLAQANLPISALNNPEGLLPLTQCMTFGEMAARSEGIDCLGLIVGQQTKFYDLGNFGKLVCQSLTLNDLLGKLFQLHDTLVTGVKVWLSDDGDYYWLNHEFITPGHIPRFHADCFALSTYLDIFCLIADAGWQPDEIHFQGRKAKVCKELDCLPNITIHFNQPNNAIRIPKALFSKPITHPQAIYRTNSTEAELMLTAPATDFQNSLRQLILVLLPDMNPNLAIAAEATGMSIRTFQRRLEESGLIYSNFVERVRFEKAIDLLKDPSHQLIDIAFDLGYADAANFTRAFKRWTGVSPRQFRQLHLQG